MSVIDTGTRRDLPSMLERMTLIVDAFDGPTQRLTLEEVADRTRLPRSTVHRILDQLVRLDWMEHVSSGYRMGWRAIGFGGHAGHTPLREAAAPILHDLHIQTGMVVHLSVLDGGESFYLDKIGGRAATSVPSRVGGRVPAYSTACGKAVLAWTDPERVDALYPEQLNRYTGRTIPDLPALHHELNRIRQRNGLAFEYGESLRGIGCVGAAVRGPDGPVAGISLCGDEQPLRLRQVAPLVVHAVRVLTRALYPDAIGRRRARDQVGPPMAEPGSAWPPNTLDHLLADPCQWL